MQLTTDDSVRKFFTENGKPSIQNGILITKSMLSNAIGQSQYLEVATKEIPFEEFEAIILASDGFYGLYDFDEYATAIAQSADMKKLVLKIHENIADEINDDASFSAFRLPNKEVIDFKSYLNQSPDTCKIPITAIVNILEAEFRQAISDKDITYIENILSFMERKMIFFNKEKMIEFLNFMITQRIPLIDRLTLMIRKI